MFTYKINIVILVVSLLQTTECRVEILMARPTGQWQRQWFNWGCVEWGGGGCNGDSQLVICNWNWNKIGSVSKPSGGTLGSGGRRVLNSGDVCWNMRALEWRISVNPVWHKRFFHIFDNRLRMKISPNRAGRLQIYLSLGSPKSKNVWYEFYNRRDFYKMPLTKFVEVNASEVVMTLFIVNDTLISLKTITFYIFCI